MLDTVLSLHFPQYYCLLPLTAAPASHRLAINLVVWPGGQRLLSAGLLGCSDMEILINFFLNCKSRSPNPRLRV